MSAVNLTLSVYYESLTWDEFAVEMNTTYDGTCGSKELLAAIFTVVRGKSIMNASPNMALVTILVLAFALIALLPILCYAVCAPGYT